MTRARAIAALAGVAAVAAVVLVLARGGGTHDATPGHATNRATTAPRLRLAELRHQEPGSLAGHVTSAAGPVGGATVCARSDGAPSCAPSAADGAWELADLPPGSYAIWASAPGLGGGAAGEVRLGAGEHRTGVDLALLAGAVEVRGTVRDVRGAPIAGAQLRLGRGRRAPPTYATRTGADGAFSAWALPGDVYLAASADGFVDGDAYATAPDASVAIVLTPGGSLAGTVIDAATRAPVADADVDGPGGERARTDAAGHFVIAKLPPGRYKPTATAIGGYGEAAQSVLVALGAKLDGIVIELHPVAVVAGRVVIGGGRTPADSGAGSASLRACPAGEGDVQLARYGSSAGYFAQTIDDGVVLLEGVVPGTYAVTAHCKHWLSQVPYPDLVVGDSDVDELTWRVSASARVTGRVRTQAGEPIAGATVNITAADRVSVASVESGSDGAFAADGLGGGLVTLDVSATGFLTSHGKVTAQAVIGASASCEVVLDRGGAIAGLVVDERGAPAAGVEVDARPDFDDDTGNQSGHDTTDRAGAFRIEPLAAGAYHVELDSPYHLPPEHSVPAVVALNATADVRLVAPSPSGAIDGTVVDARGAPIADAYVTAGREDGDAETTGWWPHFSGLSEPVLTAADGTFHIGKLPAAKFALRAYRPGGGEAHVRHVSPGDRITVAIRPTGVLAGVVVSANGAPVTDVIVAAVDRQLDVSREERAYFTGGQFALRDLPAGSYKLTVDGDPETDVVVPLADAEQRTDLRLVAKPRYALRGRLVHAGTPLVGWRIECPRIDSVDHGADGRFMETDTIQMAVTASDGTFLCHDLPATQTTISAFDATRGPDAPAAVTRDVTPAGTAPLIELGDLVVP